MCIKFLNKNVPGFYSFFKKYAYDDDCSRLKDWTQVGLFSSISYQEKNDTVSDLVFYKGKSREL